MRFTKPLLQTLFATTVLSLSLVTTVDGQLRKTVDNIDAQSGIGFGRALTAGGGQVFIGEYRTQDAPGAVYVYQTSIEGEWLQRQKLEASTKADADGFGYALAVSSSGSRLVVSSLATESAVVFEKNGDGDWIEQAVLLPSDTGNAAGFGRSVAIADSTIAIGANDRAGTGAAFIFEYDTSTAGWVERQVIDGFGSNDQAGTSVAFAGEQLAIGAPSANSFVGQVYIYDRSSGMYQPADTLVGDSANPTQSFGYSMAATNDQIVVGDYRFLGRNGRAIIYSRDELTNDWNESLVIDHPEFGTGSWFGFAVHMDESAVIIGAPYALRDLDFPGAGYVYVPDVATKWRQQQKILGSVSENTDFAGVAVAIAGGVAVLGASGDDNGLGGAYVFERTGEQWDETAYLFQETTATDIVGGKIVCDAGFAAGYPCLDIDLVSHLSTESLGGARGAGVNDIWGWTDPVSGREYAIVGRTDGTSFVDVSDPLNPVTVASLPTNGSNSGWRDVKVYADHAFIVSEAENHGMQVFDLTRLRSTPAGLTIVDADAVYDGFGSAHNVVINEQSGLAIGVGTRDTTCPRGLHMVDVTNPQTPTYAGCFRDVTTGRGDDGYSHDAHCVIYNGPDTEHVGKEICVGLNETAISIADVTNRASPVALSTATYPNASYVHQGWLSEDHRYLYQNDELDETGGAVATTTTFIWDLVDLDDPQLASTFAATTTSTDHNLYVHDGLLYQSNYTAGLRILDLTNPTVPVEEAFFDVYPANDDNGFNGTWSNYPYFESEMIVMTGRAQGLFVLARSGNPVAIDEQGIVEPNLVTAYPNPVSGVATIRIQSASRQSVRITIYDLLGRRQLQAKTVVADQGESAVKIDLSALAAGTYMIRAIGDDFRGSTVIVKAN